MAVKFLEFSSNSRTGKSASFVNIRLEKRTLGEKTSEILRKLQVVYTNKCMLKTGVTRRLLIGRRRSTSTWAYVTTCIDTNVDRLPCSITCEQRLSIPVRCFIGFRGCSSSTFSLSKIRAWFSVIPGIFWLPTLSLIYTVSVDTNNILSNQIYQLNFTIICTIKLTTVYYFIFSCVN